MATTTTAIRRKSDLLLALLVAGKSETTAPTADPIEGITRLEKLLFLLKMEAGLLKNVQDSDDFHFLPFRMGPWTGEVYDEVDFLESIGLLSRRESGSKSAEDIAHDERLFSDALLDKYQKNSSANDKSTEQFRLSEAGRHKALEIWNRLTSEEKTSIIQIKKRFNGMNLRQLLRYVYQKYPKYASESEIKESLGL